MPDQDGGGKTSVKEVFSMADCETLLTDWVDIPSYGMAFRFQFIRQSNNQIHIYILSQPPYAYGQATGGHDTHRYGLPDRPYICYDPMPTNMSDAKIIALEWAKRTAYYIRNGKWFQKGELSGSRRNLI